MNKNIFNIGLVFTVIFFALVSFGGVSADEWQMFHHDIQQTGYSISHAPSYNHSIWEVSGGQLGASGSPVIFRRTVFFISNTDNKIYAISLTNGSKIWERTLPDLTWNYTIGNVIFMESFTPAVVDNRLLVGTRNCTVYALNISTGDIIWSRVYGTNETTGSFLTANRGRLYIKCHGSTNSTLHSASVTTGDRLWSMNFTKYEASTQNPAMSGELLFMSLNPCEMTAINVTSGRIVWNYSVEEGCGYAGLASPMVTNGKVIFGSDRGYVYFLNKTTGEEINVTNLGQGVYGMTPAAAYGMIFIGTGIRTVLWNNLCILLRTHGKMFALNETNGNIIWSLDIGDAVQSSPSVADGKVFFGSANDIFYAVNASNGNIIWTYKTNGTACAATTGIYSSPAIANGAVVVTASQNTIAFKTLILVFVRIGWNDSINFYDQVQNHLNVFLNAYNNVTDGCRNKMPVEVKIVDKELPIANPICTAIRTNTHLALLTTIKEWAFINNSVKGDRYIGLTTENPGVVCNRTVRGFTVRPPAANSDTTIQTYHSAHVTAHELGHTYGLCDEYFESEWKSQNARSPCPNPYPCGPDNLHENCRVPSDRYRIYIHGYCNNSLFFYQNITCGGPKWFFNPRVGCRDMTLYRIGPSQPGGYCTSLDCPNACSCNDPLVRVYWCLTAVYIHLGNNNYGILCAGRRFNDDSFSIMSGAIINLRYQRYPVEDSYMRNLFCNNSGFVGNAPIQYKWGTSGMANPTKSLKITLKFKKNGSAEIIKVERVDSPSVPVSPDGGGDHSIKVKDDRGNTLYEASFEVSLYIYASDVPLPNDVNWTYGSPGEVDEAIVVVTIPYYEGYERIMNKIEVCHKDQVIADHNIDLINGGFETGDLTGWTAGGPGDHKVDTRVPRTGNYSALIGFRDRPNVVNGYDHIYQTITVPADTRVNLSFWYRFYTEDYCNFDFFTVYIRDVNGRVLDTVVNRCLRGAGGRLKDTGWTHVRYDLSRYAGRKIQVYFEVSNRFDALFKSWAYVDDVTIR